MRAGVFLFFLGTSLLLGRAVGSPQVPDQPLAGAADVTTTSRGLPKLFSEPSDGGASAASAISTRNRPVNGRVATLTLPGAAEQPAIKLVSINTQVLANKPRRMALDLPGSTTLVVTRRADLTPTTPVTGAAASGAITPGPLTTQWVGEVVGAKGPASSAVLLTSEDGGVYGKITFIDRQTNTRRTFTVSPLIEDGVDEAAVAGAPNVTAASLASLYPKIDTSRHVVMEVVEPNYKALLRASHHVLEAPQDATAAAATPNMIDTTLELLPGQAATHTPVQPPQDAQALAEAMAASAGNTTTATAADYLAAAESWMQGQTAASSATFAAVPNISDLTPTPQTTAEGVDAGRKLLQSTNTVHDMLAVYTPAAAAALGGEVSMQMAIRVATAEVNKIYADSRVPITVNIVGIRLLANYVERDTTGHAIQDDARTGKIPNLHTWRNQTGADFVTSWSKNGCGLGWVDVGSEWQYANIGVGCLSGTVAAHEIGHLGGCDHNARFEVAPKPYAYGFSRCDAGQQNFNTLLGRGCGDFGASPEGVEIPLFANPSLTWAGMPAGDATNAHCARALTESRVRIAGYRNSTPPTTGTITSGLSASKCITAPNINLGTQVTLQDCSSSNNNQRLHLTVDGSLRIGNTNRCLDVRNAGVASGTAVQVWDCNGTPAQQWFYDQWRRLHPYHAPDKCLETPGTTNGALLSLKICSAASLPGSTPRNNQVWSSTTPGLLPQMPVIQDTRIRSHLNKALCLDVYAFNYANSASILTWYCNDLNNQKWQFGPNGLMRSTHNTAKCMVVDPASGTKNGAAITIFDCNTAFGDGPLNQRWFVDRFFRLRPYNAPTKCVDIMSANTAAEGRVQLWDCVLQAQQIWTSLK